MAYCFHYAKRVWELGRLLQENTLSLSKAEETIQASLGKLGAAEDSADIRKLSSGEYKSAEQMAGTRFFQCGKTLRLPMEDRHLAVSESCFSLLKLPRYVNARRSEGKSAEAVKKDLQARNPSTFQRLTGSLVDDVYSAKDEHQFSELNRTLFLSCIAAGGSPGVR